MSANDELRRLLDERGIKWWPMHDIEAGYYQDRDTEFVIDGKKYTAHEWGGKLTVYGLTPAQAIAATLDAGTCRMEYCDELSGDELYPTVAYECSACGYVTVDGKPNFCPNCGRKVVDE